MIKSKIPDFEREKSRDYAEVYYSTLHK